MSEGPRIVRLLDRKYVDVAMCGESLTVGRQSDNQISIRDKLVSRYHLRIERSGGTSFLLDLASTHGTFVNGVRVEGGPRALVHGDILCVGGDPGHLLVYLERDDEAAVTRALTTDAGAPRPQPRLDGQCPLCGTEIVRSAPEAPLPASCPRCARAFVMIAKLEAPQLVRTRFRPALRAEVAGLPCLVREPIPLPLPPGLREGNAAPVALEAKAWTPAELRHERDVVAVAALDDGRIRSVDEAGDIRTWDPSTGEELERLATGLVVLALSPDGRNALVAGPRGSSILELESGAVVRGPARGGAARYGAFASDGRIVIASDGIIDIHPADLSRPRSVYAEGPYPRGPVLLVDDQALELTGGRLVARVGPLPGLAVFDVPGQAVVAAAPEPSGDGIVLAVSDAVAPLSQLLLLDLGTRRTRPLVPQLHGVPSAIAVSPDGHLIAYGENSGRVTCVRRSSGGTLMSAPLHTRRVRAMAFDPKSERLVTGGADGRVAVVPLDRSEPRADEGPAGGTLAIAVAARAGSVVSVARDGIVRVRDAYGNEHGRWRVEDLTGELAVDAAGRTVAIANGEVVGAFDCPTGQQLWMVGTAAEGGTAPPVTFRESEGAVVSVVQGRMVAWRSDDGRELWRRDYPRGTTPVAFLPGGEELLAIGSEGGVVVVSVKDGTVLRHFGARTGLWPHSGGRDFPRPIRPRGASPDGTHVSLIAAAGLSAVFLDVKAEQAWRPGGHARVSAVAAAPGGSRFAVAYELYGLVIFAPDHAPLARWVPAGILGPFDRRIDALSFSPDGDALYAGTREGQLLRFTVP
jgi:WD40 repeat protein